MLSLPSQVLVRNEDFLIAENILVINYGTDNFISELKQLNPSSNITAFTSNAAIAKQNHCGSVNSIIDAQLPSGCFDLIIFYYPKAKPEAIMLMDNIRAISNEQTRLLIVGENKGGVRSAPKQMKPVCAHGRKVDSARHCSLFQFVGLVPNPNFVLSDYAKEFNISVNNQELTLITLPGVFSHGELDKGTELLLNTVTLDNPRSLLDFACGCGVIATFFGKVHPNIELSCSDVSALAIAATKLTLAKNGLSANCYLTDGIGEITAQFDQIVSNPPFHTGLDTDYSISHAFIENAKSRLNKQGQLAIVANAFLPYPNILDNTFGSFITEANNKSFAIYTAAK